VIVHDKLITINLQSCTQTFFCFPYLMGKLKLKKVIALFKDTSTTCTHKTLATSTYYTWQNDEFLVKRKL